MTWLKDSTTSVLMTCICVSLVMQGQAEVTSFRGRAEFPPAGGLADALAQKLADGVNEEVFQSSWWWSLGGQEKEEEEYEGLQNPLERAKQGLPWVLLSSAASGRSQIHITDIYLPSKDPLLVNNTMCVQDVTSVINAITDQKLRSKIIRQGIVEIISGSYPFGNTHFWPVQMPDSWGKLPDGMFSGNTSPWGMIEQCTALRVNETLKNPTFNALFRGKYCLVSLQKLSNDSTNARVFVPLSSQVPANWFKYGTCVPSSCSAGDLQVSVSTALAPLGVTSITVDCRTMDDVVTPTSGEMVFFVVLVVLVCLIMIAAIVDYGLPFFSNHETLKKGPLKFLLVFSARTNLIKIFELNVQPNPDTIFCLHGIRALSMTWVVWAHSYQLNPDSLINPIGALHLLDRPIDQTVANASLSVDSFFLLSGLLVAYGLLKELRTTKRINWVMLYVHRFLRLSPAILLTCGAMACLPRYLMTGPMAAQETRNLQDTCAAYWWVDPVFMTNFAYDLFGSSSCLGQCWYTAVDTQLLIVVPLILAPLLYKPKLGIFWLGVLSLVSIVIPAILIGVNGYPPSLMANPFAGRGSDAVRYMYDVYEAPWSRAGAYLVGMWTGYLLFVTKGKKLWVLRTWWAHLLGWAAAAMVALLVLYGLYPYNVYMERVEISDATSILYGALARPAWALALAWVIISCHHGYGGPVNSFLSHPTFQPLSRLTFCMFLVCLPLQEINRGIIFQPLYLNHLNTIIWTCGFLFLGGLVAVMLSLMVERPVLALEKLLLKRPGHGDLTLSTLKDSNNTH